MDRKGSTTFYSTSPLWSDLTPIPLQDTVNPDDENAALATIAYSPRYAEAMSYLRALMALNEHSPRALTLTADIISMNPAHYTVWLYRARTLRSLGDAAGPTGYLDRVADELAWLDDGVCARNLKNYQVWHHRQTMVDALRAPPEGEREFLTAILALDTKNYHVWTYRQWLCGRFAEVGESREEMESVEVMIGEDVRNNSAWSHRFFLCFGMEDLRSKDGGGVVDEEVVETEVDYAMEKIGLAPQNACPWNYLKGVLKRGGRGLECMQKFCEEFVGDDLLGNGVRSSHAVDWLAEIYQKQGEQRRAEECLDALSKKWDPIRANYWEYRKKQVVPVA
jgi:protein farnesyltransferase/geranylgeranyltransferase type-1 subunit alpha